MREFTADLHIHTCLSPCGDLDMTPKRIMKRAAELGLDIIAIADHNSAENLEVAAETARAVGICFIPAMEMTSREEAHILGLFETVQDALRMQEAIYEALLPGENDERLWGEQVVVNARDEVLGFNSKLLIGATRLSLNEIIQKIHSLGGLAVASHIDRGSFSIISQLGFIPPDMEFDAFEIINRNNKPAGFEDACYLTNSDAHRLEDIGKRTNRFFMGAPSFSELKLALRAEGGRVVLN